jgi:hypothetical protein
MGAAMTVRPEIVDALVAGLAGRMSETEFGEVESQATDEEKRAVAGLLAKSAVAGRPAVPLLNMTLPQLVRLGRQGHALLWLADQLSPRWVSRPLASLGDVLKIEPEVRLRHFAEELHGVDLHELCDHAAVTDDVDG